MPAIGPTAGFAESIGLRWLNTFSGEISRSIERLATGKRINRASDDPAGSVAVENLSAEELSVRKRIDRNDVESRRLDAIDGGLSAFSDLLNQLQSDVIQAANTDGTTDAERRAAQTDADSIIGTLDFLSQTTTFKGEQILRGFAGSTLGQTLVGSSDPHAPDGQGGAGETLGLASLRTGGKLNLINGDHENAQKVVQSAIDGIVEQRASIGARGKQLEAETDNLLVQHENILGARSAIQDTDYAHEVGQLLRAQVMQQAAVFAISTARNISASTVLSLLGGVAGRAKG